MARPRKYTIDMNLTLAISAEDEHEARDLIENFLNTLEPAISSDDPSDDHYRILMSKFYWLGFTDHGEIKEGEF